jgi:hypothetical protein
MNGDDEPCPSENSDDNENTDTEDTPTDLNSERLKLVGQLGTRNRMAPTISKSES